MELKLCRSLYVQAYRLQMLSLISVSSLKWTVILYNSSPLLSDKRRMWTVYTTTSFPPGTLYTSEPSGWLQAGITGVTPALGILHLTPYLPSHIRSPAVFLPWLWTVLDCWLSKQWKHFTMIFSFLSPLTSPHWLNDPHILPTLVVVPCALTPSRMSHVDRLQVPLAAKLANNPLTNLLCLQILKSDGQYFLKLVQAWRNHSLTVGTVLQGAFCRPCYVW